MKAKPKKRKSKGRQHPLHAESLDRMSAELETIGAVTIAKVFRHEAKRVRTILR
jgi:hypothetical protein